jgi:hypothetical protein
MSDIQEKILELMDLFDEDEVTTANKIPRPQSSLDKEAFDDFNIRNPLAGGGMLVQPSADGSRPGYAKPVGTKKGKFTTKAMDNISDAILKAYADDDIQILFEKGKNNPQGLLTPQDSKAGIFQKIKTDQDRLNTVVKNTGLDQETILNILDDRDAFLELEKTTVSQETRFKDRAKFFKKAEKWLTTNAKRYADPVKFEKAFARTFGKNNLITKTIKANITEARGKGRLSGFSDDFINTIMSVREGTTKADNAFNSIQLKDMFKTVIYNNNPNVRKRITAIFENIIPKPGSRRTPDIRNLFANDPVLKKFGLNKSIKGPIARLIANEINEELLTNVKNFQKPFLGTDALLSFLKDRVDPKYKKMFGEASNAVKQAQKNQWPQAKKTLNLAQDLNFDHKIPKSIIDLGYADEIEYIKLNPTSQKFNQTIKRSQFDTPMNELIRKFEQTKTLDGKAAVVKEMNTLKNKFSKKYGGYLDEVTITPDKTGKPIFKSSAAPVTKKTDFISSLGKSLTQTGEINKKQLQNLLKQIKTKNVKGVENALKQTGVKGSNAGFISRELLESAAKGIGNVSRVLAKYGILPEVGFLGGDYLVRTQLGDSPKEAFLRASDFYRPGDQTKEAEMLETSRFFGDKAGQLVGRVIDYEKQLAKIENLKQQKQSLENLTPTSDFSYLPDTSQGIKNINDSIKQATIDLNNKFNMTEAERTYANRIREETDDARMATSNVAKTRLERSQSPSYRMSAPQAIKDMKSQTDLDLNMFPSPATIAILDPEKGIQYKNLSESSFEDVQNYRQLLKDFNVEPPPTKLFLGERDRLRGMLPSEAAEEFGAEQAYGASGTFFGQPLAGGGIAKIAGIDQGPPPESGPNSQGLKGLFKRAKNI